MMKRNPHTHTHRAHTSETRGFSHCVAPDRCNPAAHGNVTATARCRCGATRESAINQVYLERGSWREETR